MSGATPGMPEVFAALEVLGTGLMHAGSPVGDGALSLDWWIKGVGGVSVSTGVSGDEDPATFLFDVFAFCNVSSFLT